MQEFVIKREIGIRKACQCQPLGYVSSNGIRTRVDNGITHYPLFALYYYFKTLLGCLSAPAVVCGETDVSQCLTIIDQTILFYFLPHPPVPPDALSAALLVHFTRDTDFTKCRRKNELYTDIQLSTKHWFIRKSKKPLQRVAPYNGYHFCDTEIENILA